MDSTSGRLEKSHRKERNSMKLKIGERVIDPSVEPVVLIFENMKDKKEFRKSIRSIQITALKFSICSNGMNNEEQEFQNK